jgi:hypothetical protein
MIQSLKIALVLLITASAVGCSTPAPPLAPVLAPSAIPAEWTFLELQSVERILESSDTSFTALASGDIEMILSTSVANAVAAGWTEVDRTAIFGGTTVFFDGTDGSLLTVTVSPKRESILVELLLVSSQ